MNVNHQFPLSEDKILIRQEGIRLECVSPARREGREKQKDWWGNKPSPFLHEETYI